MIMEFEHPLLGMRIRFDLGEALAISFSLSISQGRVLGPTSHGQKITRIGGDGMMLDRLYREMLSRTRLLYGTIVSSIEG